MIEDQVLLGVLLIFVGTCLGWHLRGWAMEKAFHAPCPCGSGRTLVRCGCGLLWGECDQ